MIFYEGNNDHQRLNPEPTALRGAAEAILVVQARLTTNRVSDLAKSLLELSCVCQGIASADLACALPSCFTRLAMLCAP
jgi:hypothetical protein